jgi:tRNA modification GTPase
MPRLRIMTAAGSGAVALLQLHGPGAAEVLALLTGQRDWPEGRLRLVDFDGLDRGLAVRLRDDWVQLMPHGGPQLLRRLTQRLLDAGCVHDEASTASELYPEAESELEAQALATVALAVSPAAVDRLLMQPRLWHEAQRRGRIDLDQVRRDSAVLDRLVLPPTVVVVGRPNIGKSTLSNHLLGRAASVVADLPGTTRDWVGGITELLPAGGEATRDAVAVRWLDTPGLRHSDDAIEQRAIEAARQVIATADVLVAMRDGQTDWPVLGDLPRRPELWVWNKADVAAPAQSGDGSRDTAPLALSAATGAGVDALQQRVLTVLNLNPPPAGLWAFCPALLNECPPAADPVR